MRSLIKNYPAGILDEWTVGLGKTIGWEACQKYIDSLSQIEKANEESTDEPYTIYSNPEETSNENDSSLGEAFMNDVINREEEKGEIDAAEIHHTIMSQKAEQVKDMIEKKREDETLNYEVLNRTDMTIDQDLIDNIVLVAFSDNAFNQGYQKEYERGNVQIQLDDYNEYELSQDEALALYYKEQEERNETVSNIIGIIGTKGKLAESVGFLANKLLQGNSVTEEAMVEAIKGTPIEDIAKKSLISYFMDRGH